MARDRKAEAERRNARARAAGFKSYGQMYRAGRQGYAGQGTEYNLAVRARRDDRAGVKVAATKAGTVLSIEVRRPGDASRMMTALRRRMG